MWTFPCKAAQTGNPLKACSTLKTHSVFSNSTFFVFYFSLKIPASHQNWFPSVFYTEHSGCQNSLLCCFGDCQHFSSLDKCIADSQLSNRYLFKNKYSEANTVSQKFMPMNLILNKKATVLLSHLRVCVTILCSWVESVPLFTASCRYHLLLADQQWQNRPTQLLPLQKLTVIKLSRLRSLLLSGKCSHRVPTQEVM